MEEMERTIKISYSLPYIWTSNFGSKGGKSSFSVLLSARGESILMVNEFGGNMFKYVFQRILG